MHAYSTTKIGNKSVYFIDQITAISRLVGAVVSNNIPILSDTTVFSHPTAGL